MKKLFSLILALLLFSIMLYNTVIGVNIDILPQLIIIDAGHGGFDSGAVASNGICEKDINLQIALKLDETLKLLGYNTLLTRESDTALNNDKSSKTTKQKDLRYRLNLMHNNTNAIFISIHQNKFSDASVCGFQTFYSAKSEESKNIAESIQFCVNNNLQQKNQKFAKYDTRNIFLLKNATIPTVFAECGFLSNKTDFENLNNKDYQYKIALAIAFGLNDYLIKKDGKIGKAEG